MRERLWKIGERVFDVSRHGLIMGVLNVTPDSFSEHGQFFSADKAIERGLQMAAEGATPKGVHGTNDFGKSGYKGPCPPPGTHRYSFKIFALDREMELRSGAKRSQVDAAMKGHVIAQGELVGRYARSK